MRRRVLGRTGFEVSEVGLGTWGLGGNHWRDVSPQDAQRALYVAFDCGINFVDTALIYGAGQSEVLVGQVVRELRARDWAVVATAVSPRAKRAARGPSPLLAPRGDWQPGHPWPPGGAVPLHEAFPVDYVVHSVERSLRNLRAEVLAIAQLQVWDDTWLETQAWSELRGTMQRLIKEGKVLHWGVSLHLCHPDQGLGILADPLVTTVQVTYNVFARGCEREVLARARANEVGVIARAPFDEGALGGDLRPETQFPAGDWRNHYFGGSRLAQVLERVAALGQFVGEEVATLPELALRFCLAQDAISTVAGGMRRVDHVRQNAAVSDGRRLSEALMERLREHAWDKNWYGETP